MRIIYAVLALWIMTGTSCTSSEKQETETQDSLVERSPEAIMQAEAEEIGLRYIRTFFDGDCEQSMSMMSDSLLDLGSYQTSAKTEMELGICSSLAQAVKDPSKTYRDYVNTYHITVRSAGEMLQLYPDALPPQIKEGDHFFDGHHVKEELLGQESFIWPQAYTFLLRKEEGVWKIKGFGAMNG